jgi:hypothetical protein
MDLIEIWCQDLDFVHLDQDREWQWPLMREINFGFQKWWGIAQLVEQLFSSLRIMYLGDKSVNKI